MIGILAYRGDWFSRLEKNQARPWGIFALYFFRERISQAGPLARTLAASVYTVYIIHQTLVIAVDILFIPISIPTILKFVFVSIISVPLCFGLGVLVRKIPYAQRVLG